MTETPIPAFVRGCYEQLQNSPHHGFQRFMCCLVRAWGKFCHFYFSKHLYLALCTWTPSQALAALSGNFPDQSPAVGGPVLPGPASGEPPLAGSSHLS